MSSFRYEVIRPKELSDEDCAQWLQMQHANTAYASPFFHPSYSKCLAEVRDDVEVGVIRQGGRAVGFFPYQRGAEGAAFPLGRRLSDLEGPILDSRLTADSASGESLNIRELLRGCGLREYRFSHLIWPRASVTTSIRAKDAHFIDLSDGMNAYEAERKATGSSTIQQVKRKLRKLEREHGDLHLRFSDPDESLHAQILEWKTAQRNRTNTFNVLELPWVREFLKRLLACGNSEFGGIQSSLYAGNQLIAAHFGLRSNRVIHYWFPTYNASFSKYSPGLLLIHQIAVAAAAEGVARIDLGTGADQHKLSMASGIMQTLEGTVCQGKFRQTMNDSARSVRRWLKSFRAYEQLKRSLRWIQRKRLSQTMR